MTLIPFSQSPTFNLLSIGHRGVGKTVFLAGSYFELTLPSKSQPLNSFVLECKDTLECKNLKDIISYIEKTGQYPPPTLKITNFDLNLQQKSQLGQKTLCHFRWWDLPGEYCDFGHLEFKKIVLSSHSCCLFINAEQLLEDQNYLKILEPSVNQVLAIARLLDLQKSQYAFAIIFTHCDRLQTDPIVRLQIEEKIKFLIEPLEILHINYRRFYSSIEILKEAGKFKFVPSGAAMTFLWLFSALTKKNKSTNSAFLETSFQQDKALIPFLPSQPFGVLRWLIFTSLGLIGVVMAALFAVNQLTPEQTTQKSQDTIQLIRDYQVSLKHHPDDFDTLSVLANLYLAQNQYEQALPLMEKIVKIKPQDLNWQLHLAKIYELTEQSQKAQQTYDRILAQDKNHIEALLGKAQLLKAQGDSKEAEVLFQKAKQLGSTNLQNK